jgi:hypothetical protein
MRNTYNLKDGRIIEVIQDNDAQNPREEWDNFGTMICFHRRYTLGDKHKYDSPDEAMAAVKKQGIGLLLPMYMYDHSGITIRTTPFSCPWDSGQIGFIYITKAKLREEYSVKRVTKKIIEKARLNLLAEVTTYNQFLTGETFGFKTYANEEAKDAGEEQDSCWGFYGSDILENGILEQAGAKAEDLITL